MPGPDDTPRLGARWFRLRPRRPADLEAQVREELDAHISLATDHLVAHGVPTDRATREARARFGDFDAAMQRLYVSARHREEQLDRRDLIGELRQDTQLALRLFRRSPAFFAAAVLTLALGIGANGAVFSILQSALLQPLPYRNPDELVVLRRMNAGEVPTPNMRLPGSRLMTSPMVLAWRREASAQLGEVAAILMEGNTGMRNHDSSLDLVGSDRTTRFNGATVTPNFFELLGVHAARGRVFTTADDRGSDQLIVLSDALWRREFGGDPAVVGRSITLATGMPRTPTTLTVAGVLPRGFHYTYPDEVEAWVLMRWSDVERHPAGHIAFSAVARLRPGVSLVQARHRAAELPNGIDRPGKEPAPDRIIIALDSMYEWVVGEIRPSLQLLGAVAALLLLVTCVTVSNGLLARVSERQQELAVRTALGAGRSRLVRQLLTEGALLSIGGAVAGTTLAVALQPILRAVLPASVPRIGEISLNASIIAFGAAVAALTTILAAVAPAWGGTRLDAAAMLTRAASTASATRSTQRWRQGLVGAQAAIATALLIFAALLLTSFWQLGRVPLGFDGHKVVTVELELLDFKYLASGWAVRRFQDELFARLRTIPGIADVGMTSSVPFRGHDYPATISRRGSDKSVMVRNRVVDAGYFKALHVPALRGRLLDDTDREGTPPVVVISESYARKAFGTESPIGQQIGTSPALTIVGVVGDLRYAGLEEDPTPAIYSPRAQADRPMFAIVARMDASTNAAAVVPAIRRVIRELDPALPAANFATIDEVIDRSVANRRFYTVATAAFAAIALLLTVVGLVVVVARVVAERRRELAIRAALGATMRVLARVAARDALIAVCGGVTAGLVAAYAGSIVLAQFLFHVAPRSPAAYGAVALLILTVAVVSAWGPMRRFDQTSLAVLLKSE